MDPKDRAKNALYRDLMAMAGRWDEDSSDMTPSRCARELRERLNLSPPRPVGRPKRKGWVIPGT